MKHFELNGQIREVGNKAVIKEFRKQGLIPCNLYGAGVENVLFTITEKDLKGITDTPASFIIRAGGKFYKLVRSLKVSALMKDLPDELVVNIDRLQIGKRIVAGDLKYENINVISPKGTIICTVRSSRQIAAHIAYEEALDKAMEEGVHHEEAPAAEAPAAEAPAEA